MIRSRTVVVVLALAPLALACHGGVIAANDGGTGDDARGDDGSRSPPAPVDKLDLLFMIDNSSNMGDKQALLAQAVPDLIARLVAPNCVDAQGNVVGVSTGGQCAQGMLEFQPVVDMHIGIVSSSLGGRGSDQCDPGATNPANGKLNAHNDDKGHLIDRGGADEHAVADASPSNFLAWLPDVPQNQGKGAPPVPAITDAQKLVGDFTDLISGVHEHGCGFEAQMESWYRFLVQPDPFDQILMNGPRASLFGVDATILQQRHDFLRPDSALAVVVVTDESEEVADPLLIGGQGWAFANTSFPGSPSGAAAKGSVECSNPVDPNNVSKTGPNDPNCTSCAFLQGQPNFDTECPGGAYLDPTDDNLNIRFFQQRRRFGLDAMDPIGKYVMGLTQYAVPSVSHSGKTGNLDHEHSTDGLSYYGDCTYSSDTSLHHNCKASPLASDGTPWADCTNPIFATNLPTDPNADLCHLTRGPRTASQVFFATIVGVPHQLLQVDPGNPDSPQKRTLAAADWVRILGNDPEHYDFTGADYHMLESETDRPGSPCPAATAADNCDPINGREWDTGKGDLQFACIFDIRPLYGGVGKNCGDVTYTGACSCAMNSQARDSPLCSKTGGNNPDQKGYTDLQIYGKAYPGIRELEVARALGDRSVVSSICPIHTADNAQKDDPLYGYRPAMQALVDRLATVLQK
jgi:hypothetical protein